MICISIETILNAIIAIGAIAAVFVTVWAVLQTKKFMQEEKESRRAYISPEPVAGYIDYEFGLEYKFDVYVNLVNYGAHPADHIKITLFAFYGTELNGKNVISYWAPFGLEALFNNPVPHDAQIPVRFPLKENEKVNFQLLLSSGYIILSIEYRDSVLNKKFTGDFSWKIDTNGQLSPLQKKDYSELLIIRDQVLSQLDKKDKKEPNA